MAAPPKFRRSHIDFVHTRTFTPREYQIELLDAAKEKNVIACLGTGTGKTFIAVMLIREMSNDVRRHLDKGGKRTIFLVPTVPLVRQQSQVLQDHTDLKVGEYHRDLGVENWPKDILKEELQKNQVLVMTPDICKYILNHGFLKLSTVNLIIVDECHRAVKNHPYRDVMRCFDVCPSENRPRILGLSASLLNRKCKPFQLEEQIQNLQKSLRSTVQMASDLTALSTYVTKPKEKIQMYRRCLTSQSQYYLIHRELERALSFFKDVTPSLSREDDLPNPVKHSRCYLMEVGHVLVHLGPWCTQLVVRLFMKEISCQVDFAPSDIHRLMILLTHTVLQKVEKYCEDVMEGHTECQRILDDAPHKLKVLLEILLQYKPEEQQTTDAATTEKPVETTNAQVADSGNKQIGRINQRRLNFADFFNGYDPKVMCGIIFVKQRVTAYVLSHWLNQVSVHHPDFKFLSTSYIVGQGSSGQQKMRLGSHSQEEVLRKFRTREYNLLIATSVVEEGLDVPKCNLVVRFDLPEDFRAYVQSKGRARAPVSSFYMLVPEDDSHRFRKDIFNYALIEKILLREHQNRDRPSPSEEEISDHLADQKKDPYMPFKEDGAPRVTMTSAIALVNRYCFKLPSDTFTKLTPKCQIEEIGLESQPSYQCTLYLPINSPLKIPIVGDVMPSKILAKMASALETCKKLHEIGELDDNLLPVGKEAVKFEEDMLESFKQEEVPPGTPRPGTTKRRQYYYKRVADNLKGNLPSSEMTCFLYVFSMKLTCPIPEEQNTRGRKIHDPASTPRAFGIITTKPIPPVCSFPVFTRSGEVTIVLEEAGSGLQFSTEQVHQLQHFHRYIFAEVLRLEKYPMLFSPDSAGNSFYVVPTNKVTEDTGWTVDWEFVNIISQQKDIFPQKQSEKERENFVFHTEDYADAVVMPWYRNLDRPQFFYVAEICSDLTPKSDFPDTGYETFEGYYREKYSIQIMNPSQPLLDVDHTSARLNLLTPRYVNRKGMTLPTSSAHTKRAKRENLQQKQILIPELCVIHPFPASLWRKAVCLPCILYRINSLLLAEELRLTVAREIGVGMVQLRDRFMWPALDFGWTLAEVLVKAQQALKEEAETQPKPKGPSIAPTRHTVNHKDTLVKGDADFVIDTFDPSKVHIPEDDDFLLDQEISEINFGTPVGPSIGMWGPAEASSMPLMRVRYGSPSNFEGTGWDSEWDMEIDESNVFHLDMPGLGYISAPGGFNIQGLSHDLASCRDDDIWDSDDDEESIYDGLEMEKPPDPANTVKMDLGAQVGNDNLMGNETTNGNFSSKLPENQDEFSYKSDWLSDCSQKARNSPVAEKEDLSLDENEGRMEKEMISIKEHLKELFGSSLNSICNNDTSDLQEFPMVLNAIQCIERYGKDDTVAGSVVDHYNDDNYEDTNNDEHQGCYDSTNEDPFHVPAFGELLPDREKLYNDDTKKTKVLRFDDEVDLVQHPGPSPSIVLQAFTMSNANDGINLERLETVGDSFLKYAITAYLYCTYTDIHEGKLSYLRSKQISNLNLYRLGKRCGLGELMIGSKFEPSDNWLPPQYTVPKGLEQALIDSGMSTVNWNIGNIKNLGDMDEEQIRQSVMEEKKSISEKMVLLESNPSVESDITTPHIRYNLLTQQSIPDKSIADCVEALIGAYLISCGPRGALLFMSWMGLKVLPDLYKEKLKLGVVKLEDVELHVRFGKLELPKSPLLTHVSDAHVKLDCLLQGFDAFEQKIGYQFQDRAYLLQAFTHASYHYNRLTDCYQRLEFLGDAVLDYLITRHLYEDPQQHYPGVLTDLRSALVNNTFFASLAVKYEFHKYFKSISPGLFSVINRFADMKRNTTAFTHFEEYYLEEDECEEAEEVEVPKALGDIFESVAGAIYLDSGMSLDVVWRVYYAMMKPEIEYFSTHVPKSPIRELLETYPQTARFDRAEITITGKVRVKVEVVGKGQFVGIGRNKRIAKCTAAKRALRALKKHS